MYRRFKSGTNDRRNFLLWLQLIFALILLPLSRDCVAQVVDPVTAAQLPIPGAGHQYVGMGTETVNPADGTVSFDLPIQTPAGRQLSFPFGIRYNGGEPFFLTNGGSSPHFNWETPALDMPTPFDVNGWSYALPNYVAQAFVSGSSPSGGLGTAYNYCWSGQNYNFRGLDGIPRTLYVTNNWADVDNPTSQSPPSQSPCTVSTYAGGGDEGLATSFGTPTTNIQPALAVTDKSGTVYQFPQGPIISTNPTVVGGGITPFGLLAQTITDKNGNQIMLTGSGNVGYTLGPGSYKDTLNRTVVSWTGLGSANGDQLTVSGLGGDIAVKWTKTTVTFPDASTNSTFLYGTGTNCGFQARQNLTISVVSEIDLPNGQKYSFTYGGMWGLLTQITFPDGGYVQYTWGTNTASQLTYQTWIPGPNQSEYCYALVDTPAITDRYVSYDGSSKPLHQQFVYSTAIMGGGNTTTAPYWSTKQTTVTSTDSSTSPSTVTVAKYSYVPTTMVVGPNFTSWQALEIPVESQIVYQDGSNKTLQTVNKAWNNRFFAYGNQTILDNGQGMTTLQCPDSSDNILATYEYDFQSNGPKPADPACSRLGLPISTGLATTAIGPLLRQTVTAYHSFAGTNILNEPDSVTVSDPSNPQDKLTKYFYDAGTTTASNAATGLVAPPGLRGNPTSVQRWLNSTNSFLTNTYTYYDTGQVYTATDPCGNPSCPDNPGTNHTTTYMYTDQYAGGTGSPPGQTNAYLTQVTYPNTGVVHQESYTWGYADGLMRSHTDQNSKTSSYTYNDPLVRLKQVQGPPDPNNGGQSPITNYTYSDWTPSAPTASNIQSSEVENVSGADITSTTTLSGMSQVLNTQATSDPAGADWVDTTYDGFGRVATVSNPHRPSSPLVATQGITTYGYDAINRKISQIDSDGTSTQMWSYSGNTVTYTDENLNQWLRTTDALGRLIQVKEPSPASKAPTLETDYTYTPLDDLLTVTQHGTTAETPVARSFVHDSLSRLMSATNAESGTTGYTYDLNGNLQSKIDARGAATGGIYYCYDALNRLTSKSYSSATCPISTPDVAYVYDTSSISGNQNTVGRLTSESVFMNGTTWTNRQPYSYNPMGRVLAEQQCTPGNCSGTPYKLQYTYDLAGNVTSSTNGVVNPGVLLTYNYDCSSRLGSVTSTWDGDTMHPAALFTAAATGTGTCPSSASSPFYTPANQLLQAQLAINATTNLPTLMLARTYDNRLRPTSETDTEPSAMPPGLAATLTVTISGAERSVGGSGNAAQATGTIAFSDPGGQVVRSSVSGSRPQPRFVGSSITLPDGYHASFVAANNNALSMANVLASVLNAASSPVTAVVVSGGTATAASVTLTAKVAGASENGSIKLSMVATRVQAAPASLTGGGGASYDTGTVTATVNATSLTTSYGQTSTPLTVAQALASAINAAALGVTATPGGTGTLTVTATQIGTAGNGIPVILASSTSQPSLFSGPSFTGTSGTLAGGTDGPTGNGTIYSYTIPASGVANGYDPGGNLLSYSDCVMGSTGCVTGTWAFSYDNLNRVSTGLVSAGQWNTLSLGWTYDSFGNRKTQSVAGDPQAGAPQSQSLMYPSNNQIMGYSYDPSGDGDLLYDNINHYVYDAEGRVCAVSSFSGMATTYLQYVYDAEGRRVGKGSINTLACSSNPTANGFALSNSYILGLSGEQISELDGSGNFLRTNVYAGGRLLANYANGSTQFAFGDWLGTKRVVANPDGTVAETCASLPFGDELICSGVDPSAHHFTGQLHDQETHNDYFGARYYSNSTARFLSPDSMPGRLEDPQSWNLYSYVLNNPLTNTDPDGHDVQVCDNNGQCNTITNAQYQAAQQASSQGGLSAPTLDHVGNSKDANGNFTSVGITNSSGQQVATATYMPGDNPGVDPYVGNNMAGLRTLGAADKVVTVAAVATGVAYSGVAAAETVPGAAAAVGRWGLQRLAFGASSPALLNLINRLYQAQDEISGGTAGAVRDEVATGEYINGGHSIKAAEMITALSNLIKSGQLSGSDQMIAGHIISDLKNSLGQ